MVVLNKKISALYVPQFNSDSPLKSKVSHLKNLSLLNFQALDLKFGHISDLWGEGVFAPPPHHPA